MLIDLDKKKNEHIKMLEDKVEHMRSVQQMQNSSDSKSKKNPMPGYVSPPRSKNSKVNSAKKYGQQEQAYIDQSNDFEEFKRNIYQEKELKWQ